MAKVTTEFSRNLLRGISWDAEDQGLTLQQALKSTCRGRYRETNTGTVIESTSGNGAMVKIAIPQEGSTLTPGAIAEAVSNLYDLYELAVRELAAEDNDEPTDAQVLARMLLLLKPRREVGHDFSQLCTA